MESSSGKYQAPDFAKLPGSELVLQGRSASEVNHLLYGPEGSSVTVEVISIGASRHVTMVRVRPDKREVSDPSEEKTWGTMCCST